MTYRSSLSWVLGIRGIILPIANLVLHNTIANIDIKRKPDGSCILCINNCKDASSKSINFLKTCHVDQIW